MKLLLKLLLSLLITLPCLGMERVGLNHRANAEISFFEQLPSDMQKLIINTLVKDVITQKSEVLSKAQSYREYKELLIQELNAYKSVSKSMKDLVSHVLKTNKELVPALLPIKKEFWKKAQLIIRKKISEINERTWIFDLSDFPLSDNIDKQDNTGNTVLMLALERITQSICYYIDHYPIDIYPMGLELIKLILDNGANPNIHNNNLQTPLKLSLDHHKLSFLELLLTYGAKNLIDTQSWTPLQWMMNLEASQTEQGIRIVKLLIETKMDLETAEVGLPPFIIEMTRENPNLEILELLLKNGVNPHQRTACGISIYKYLIRGTNDHQHFIPILELVEKYAPRETYLKQKLSKKSLNS